MSDAFHPSGARDQEDDIARLQSQVLAVNAPYTAPVVQTERDLRLDLFRGLALWLIFLDHVPNNIVSWATIRNYGFSDATEIFIFISGYTAAFVYGRAMVTVGLAKREYW